MLSPGFAVSGQGAKASRYACPMASGPTPAHDHSAAPARPAPRRRRKDEILEVALNLFAVRGYHGVSMDDIGTAAGVTGPALYHHFAGKEAMLSAALVPVSEGLRDGGLKRLQAHTNPAERLEALVRFHVAFALSRPAVIRLHFGELDRLPEESRHTVRRLQREYVEQWVTVLRQLRSDLDIEGARLRVQAVFGLLNSTPFLPSSADRTEVADVLRRLALSALRG